MPPKRNIRSSGESDRRGPKKGVVIIPARNDAKNAQKLIVITGMDIDKARVIVSLRAKKKTATTASKALGSKLSSPGWTTNITPKKPVKIKTQRALC